MKNIKRELFFFFVLLFFLYIICGCIYENFHECHYNKIFNNPHASEKYRQFNKIRLLSENKNILQFNKEKISLHDYINNDNYNTVDANDYNCYKDKEEQCNDSSCVDKKNYNRSNNNEEECSKNFYQYLKYMEQNVNVNTNNKNINDKNINDNNTELQIISNDHNTKNYKYDDNNNSNNNNSEYGKTNNFLERNNKVIDSQQNKMNNIFKETINKTLTYDMSTDNSHTNNNSRHYENQNGNREYMNLSNDNLTYGNSPYDILPYNDQNNLSQYETVDSNHCNDLNIYNPYYESIDLPYHESTDLPYHEPTDLPYHEPTDLPYHEPTDLPYYEPVSYTHDRSNNYSNRNYSNNNYSNRNYSNNNYSKHNYPHHNYSHHNYPHHNYPHHNYPHHNYPHHNYPHHRYGSSGDPYHRHDHIMDRSYYYSNLQNDNHDMMLTYIPKNDNKSLYDEQNFELELKKIIKKNHLQNDNITDSYDTAVNDFNKKLKEYNKKLNEYNEKLNEYTSRLNEYNKKHNEKKKNDDNKKSGQNNNENILSQDIVLYGTDFQNAFRYRQNTRSYYSNIYSNREEDLDKVIDFTHNNNSSEDEYTFRNKQEIYHQHSKRLEKKLFDYQNGSNPVINFLERHF
ncbi:Plasmodium exported protein (hyp1), unknown function [Plasmodium sp. gorilla clade G2]|uniref:Plasmodium exported protein (hyp1), unknown function n=1 Tax=Plasmodium sp. gorilla clade G2 TaxID=880535 RepID=UPI000D21C593|nr:Plasmodium exported protein (hyp1), unknown function [Plasmodium sp. gorilla clade G2]SOV10280.1 Plasmodium exported protein (hyp1), unknown function [Plasmodium sp. gorilla clade G2]